MAALLNDAAPLKEQDAIGFLNRGQPVGDHKHGAAGHGLLQPLLHRGFGLSIQSTGGFIEQHHRGIAEHSTGNRKALQLTA